MKSLKLLVAALMVFALCGCKKAADKAADKTTDKAAEVKIDAPFTVVQKMFAVAYDFDAVSTYVTDEYFKANLAEHKKEYDKLSAEEKEAFKAEIAAQFKKLKMSLVKETIEGDTATLIVAAEGEKEHGKCVLKKVDGVWKIASMGNGD